MLRRGAAWRPIGLLSILAVLLAADVAQASVRGAAAPAAATKVDSANRLQVCDSPGKCRDIPRYPVRVDTAWSCPPWLACTFKSSAVLPPSSARAPTPPKVDEMAVRQYPKILSSQVAMPLYQFTGEHSTLEAARRLLNAGATTFKFDLKNLRAYGYMSAKPLSYLENKGWLPLVTHPDLPYMKLFDMPFKTFMFWAGRSPGPGRTIEWSDIDGIDVYSEMYKLVVYLIKRYNGSNKTFIIGHWEGDWCIRDQYNKDSDANPKKVAQMIKLLSDKQRAIDNAKRDNAWAKNVFVWHYAEANLVENSIKKGDKWASMVNTVIGQVKPTLDMVSISVGGDSLREVNPSVALHKAMDYTRAKLPYKAGVPEPRVFAGEFYFDLRAKDDSVATYAPTPEAQKTRALWAAASGIAWGAPHMLWWAFYDNEATRSGGFRGYWLVDNGNRDTPLFRAMQQYYSDANEYVRSVLAATGKVPSEYAFRVWAVERLIQLSGRTDVWRPQVRYWNK